MTMQRKFNRALSNGPPHGKVGDACYTLTCRNPASFKLSLRFFSGDHPPVDIPTHVRVCGACRTEAKVGDVFTPEMRLGLETMWASSGSEAPEWDKTELVWNPYIIVVR